MPVRPGRRPLVQTVGLTVQNFVSPAVGLAVAVALVRGLARSAAADGRQLLGRPRARHRPGPAAARRSSGRSCCCSAASSRTSRRRPRSRRSPAGRRSIQGGLVASQEAIKELGTNGGGYFNANSAHPFENPNAFTNLVEIFLLLVIPFSLPRTYGILVGDRRQGWAVLGFMATLWGLMVAADHLGRGAPPRAARSVAWRARSCASASGRRPSSPPARPARRPAPSTRCTRASAPSGGGGVLFYMLLGEVSPGGVGSGLYGALARWPCSRCSSPG